ncbi:hypothetical protein BC629DRAFT_244153 [Irpex lacteus]|nr:hypothetical protein BC629DRAFT_244153 [Irpex lacteus]
MLQLNRAAKHEVISSSLERQRHQLAPNARAIRSATETGNGMSTCDLLGQRLFADAVARTCGRCGWMRWCCSNERESATRQAAKARRSSSTRVRHGTVLGGLAMKSKACWEDSHLWSVGHEPHLRFLSNSKCCYCLLCCLPRVAGRGPSAGSKLRLRCVHRKTGQGRTDWASQDW